MPKINMNKSRIVGVNKSPTSISKMKSKGRGKLASPKKANTSGCRQSKRLQQKKITESWSGTAHQTKTWPETSKPARKTIVADIEKTNNIASSEDEIKTAGISNQRKTKRTAVLEAVRGPIKSSSLDGLNREDKLMILRNFDLEGLYGPCRGISRRSRFQRAVTFHLKPEPQEIILEILETHSDDPEFERCIWDCNELLRVKLGSPLK